MKLQELIQNLHRYEVSSRENPDITSLAMDSRKTKKGSLFFGIKGYTVDGHDFAFEAVENGAVAIISERMLDVNVPVIVVPDTTRAMAILADVFYGQPTHKLKLIGVTGTNGKTTTTHIIEAICQHHQLKTGMIGTIYMKIGNQAFPVKNTTPDALTLQKSFQQMIENDVDTVVMEVSSHALHMGRVHGCDFDVAVLTNLTQDHLDYHHTMQEYQFAKSLLFSSLGNIYNQKKPKFAVLNSDDPSSEFFKRATAAQVLTYGIKQKSDIMAKNVVTSAKGTTFDLVYDNKVIPIHLKLVGKFSVYNVLAAISACYVSNIPMSTIIPVIESVTGVPGRFEVIEGGQDFTVIVDYAHTPDSLENVLKATKQLSDKNIYCIIGCGGDRDRSKRPLMAAVAVNYANKAVFTSDNPRSEDPEQIFSDMRAGVLDRNYEVVEDRRNAIYKVISEAEKGDVVLIAGKGHETYQLIGDRTIEFDDRKVALEAIHSKISS
ncbi:UDP-N-acetylmuramoyl-L-alanyl-D-glutamate--2,6-diaminopimelate ligase [Sutcliffiella rhizosphaerae]|uniref:UDP-N-acetylmuramoyl-L-alanyl-D-glutamate--2,6-diaminopimelate ligase n=1 Tax=Sutcliffiella rhizosphaerae TaxID=2880967 RepID=A0ABM8YIR9_9BACI|nr:UDP-N-acetylmuramoyl-L-alanyl-D-glutamate--2,6-diaminopimelate ligase [Sutcliffiella rhizosphaerae]CAG9619806.1 UDP-N-acetylmuramoyl-L-alanyl-D-glutamate--2, 6-diaminopimelate ligase [Sutcliffiella rhizosphaerae]